MNSSGNESEAHGSRCGLAEAWGPRALLAGSSGVCGPAGPGARIAAGTDCALSPRA